MNEWRPRERGSYCSGGGLVVDECVSCVVVDFTFPCFRLDRVLEVVVCDAALPELSAELTLSVEFVCVLRP